MVGLNYKDIPVVDMYLAHSVAAPGLSRPRCRVVNIEGQNLLTSANIKRCFHSGEGAWDSTDLAYAFT